MPVLSHNEPESSIRTLSGLYLLLLLLVALPSCISQRPVPVVVTFTHPVPAFKHVIVVVEENENYDEVIGNTSDMPYLNLLASRYGLATKYYANTHPSINNYFILTAGRSGTRRPWIRALSDEYPFEVEGENIASVLHNHGKSWKSYAEGIPGQGYVGDDRFPYVKRHNPFAYFASVRHDASQREDIAPFNEFAHDFQAQVLPDYAFLVPNVFHDAHHNQTTGKPARCGEHQPLRQADAWLKSNIEPIVSSAIFQKGGLLVIVFDEACAAGPNADWYYDPDNPGLRGGGHVAAIVVSSRTAPGTQSTKLLHHESVLRLSLRALGIDQLPGQAADAPDMDEFFQ